VGRLRLTASRLALLFAAVLALGGCALHVGRVVLNRPLSKQVYGGIVLGSDTRHSVLARLGPPDALFYTPTELVFDYRAARHRVTDFELFVPTDLLSPSLPVSPAPIFSALRFLLNPFKEPEQTRGTFLERASRQSAKLGVGFIPFTSGEDVLVLNGRQLRTDRLRIVFDRQRLVVTQKALRLQSREYGKESLAERVLLKTE